MGNIPDQPVPTTTPPPAPSALRLRLGIGLWLLSWVPFATAFVQFAQHEGWVTTPEQAHRWLIACWTVQIIIGLIGVFIAGSEAIALVKKRGLKRAPGQAWRIIRGKKFE